MSYEAFLKEYPSLEVPPHVADLSCDEDQILAVLDHNNVDYTYLGTNRYTEMCFVF